MKIRQLTQHGLENDPAKQKNDINKLEALKKEIKYVLTVFTDYNRKKEQQILEIKLDLK